MYELIQTAPAAYYMDCPSKVGFVRTGGNEIVCIDSGLDKDAGKKALKLIEAQGWTLKAVYNTHAHADHIGGNHLLQSRTGCRIFAPASECAGALDPLTEPIMLYGGFPPKELRTKFLLAEASRAEPLTPDALPHNLEAVPLPGHSRDMTGYRTSDGTVYLADCIASADTLQKYGIPFVYDVKASLEKVREMKAECFVPAHAACVSDIAPLAQLNIEATHAAADTVLRLCAAPVLFEDLLAGVFDTYHLTMNAQQRVLVGSTVKSYLSYLKEEGRVDYRFEGSRML